MSFCSTFIAMGMTLGGICAEPVITQMQLPKEDLSVWDARPPAEPTLAPKITPTFPPVIINKEVVREIYRVPPAPPKKKSKPKPKPDLYREWMEARAQISVQPSSEAWVEIPVTKTSTQTPNMLGAPMSSSFAPPVIEKASYDFESRVSTAPVSNDRIITTDRYITGIMEGGINSQLASDEGGSIITQVSRDVFGYGTRNELIPKGSRLVCDYESPSGMNSTRFPIKCTRILLAGNKKGQRVEISQLEAPVGDAQGRGGSSGHVNNHFKKKYGTAIMLSVISASVRGASAFVSSGRSGDNTTTATSEIADTASQELGTRFGEISASALEKSVNIVPTITSAQGKRVLIRPRKDWILKEIKS